MDKLLIEMTGEVMKKVSGLPMKYEDADDPPCPHFVCDCDKVCVEVVEEGSATKVNAWPMTAERFDETDCMFSVTIKGHPARLLATLAL